MNSLLGYEDLTQIHESSNSRVYRALRVEDRQSVILKFLNTDYPTPDQLRRYRQEYFLTSQLQLANIIKAYELAEWQHTLVMTIEDFGGISLKEWLQKYPQGLNAEVFLPIALKITLGLEQLHSKAIVHKDINPANIVINPQTGVIKLIDLGISTQLSRENPILETPNALEGTPSYLSPEQTGRMNRMLDYRTDFYSLGVTFYELLTGKCPFISDDAMELVHCHIAKQPISPYIFGKSNRRDIPKLISDIVMKLMAKNAEDRYQSAWGLNADLETCLEHYRDKRRSVRILPLRKSVLHYTSCRERISPFTLGRNDISDRFQISQKLFGREQEIAALIAAFDRLASPPLNHKNAKESEIDVVETSAESVNRPVAELILVTGYSGIGKSSLVKELYKPITAKRGYFISGKFDQFQRNIPYSAVVNAFASLVKQLLGEPEIILKQWRDRLLAALGTNGQVVIDVIPEVELIIGAQPPVPSLAASESQNRFNLVFQRFIQAFCQPDHPLVLFLDDLQWADLATLSLIERLLTDSQIDYLLLIGAYRDNEVSAGHPLAVAIAQLRQKGANLEQIILAPLHQEHVEQLIAETLHSQAELVTDLARLVICKTDGNPFFTNEFLKNLYAENLLVFDSNSGQWQWDLASIEAQGFTDNVVELMVGRLQKLAQPIQEVLSLAACLGAKFDLGTLALVGNRDAAAVFDDLKIAMEQGFIQARSPFDQNLLIQDYRFEHDRIQQAAYSLLSTLQQTQTHYQIGQILHQHLSPEALEECLFTVVNHLNYGIELIDDRFQRDRLAQLNLAACRKAKDATAYQTAATYAAIGLKFLGNDAWQRQYETTLSLHELAAEVSSLSGDFAQMHQWFDAVLAHTKTPIEQVGVYDVKIRALASQSRGLEALSTGRSILQELSIEFPDHPSIGDFAIAAHDINDLILSRMGNLEIENLFDLPLMTDVENIGKMQVLTSILAPCYQLSSPLFPLVTALQVNLSIQYGNNPTSAFSYACYGLSLCNFLQDVPTAAKFGRLAYRLASITKNIRCHTFFAIGYFLTHRYSHLRETAPIAQSAYEVGLETGNLEYAGYSIYTFFVSCFWCGQPLSELEPQLLTYREQLLNLNQLHSAIFVSVLWEATHFLLGNPQQIELRYNQPPIAIKQLDVYFCSCVHGAMLQFIIGDWAAAIAFIDQAKAYLDGGAGTVPEAEFYFYDSLILLNTNIQPFNQEHLERIQSNQTKLQHWAEYAPMNYLHKWQLVEAEKCRVFEQKTEAIELYDMAIAGAKAQGYIQEEALGNELAAKFYLNWGKATIARAFIVEAHYGYLCWGATVKVKQLETNYPDLFKLPGHQSLSHSLKASTTTTGSSGAELDLATVMKASQAIATEIVLENLLQTLMRILLENAGAQSGCLLLHRSSELGEIGAFEIAARSSTDIDRTLVAQLIADILPESILHYVARTQESILLDSAVESGKFVHDPYIRSVRPLSVLCYPLIDRGKLVAVVYLENNITTGAFTANRIALLQLLSGQAAIAIENAILYAEKAEYTRTLEQKVSDRTAELQHVNQELLKLANLDGLTQIPNRRNFDEYLAEEWQRHLREQKILTLMLIDIDYFKLYNDYYGHQGGDDCLIRVAQLIAKICQRPGDLVARYGGEEFAVILPSTHSNGGVVVAESIQKAISALAIPHAKSEISEYVTLSLGIASLIPTPEISTEDLIAHADRALYAAKHKGRDRAIVYMRS
jgi:diguanylate cyclase (GGDEF)-like protein